MSIKSLSLDLAIIDDRHRNETLNAICRLFTDILEESKKINSKISINSESKLTAFDMDCPPPEILIHYLERLVSMGNIEESTLILLLIYVDRLSEKQAIQLNESNIYK